MNPVEVRPACRQLCPNPAFPMSVSAFLLLLDELLEQPAGTLRGDEPLEALPKWDSLAVLGFIVLAEQHFGVSVPASRVNGCRTVADLAAVFGDKITR